MPLRYLRLRRCHAPGQSNVTEHAHHLQSITRHPLDTCEYICVCSAQEGCDHGQCGACTVRSMDVA